MLASPVAKKERRYIVAPFLPVNITKTALTNRLGIKIHTQRMRKKSKTYRPKKII